MDDQFLPAGIGIYDLKNKKEVIYTDVAFDSYVPPQQIEWGKNDESIYYSLSGGKKPGIWQFNLSSQEKSLLFNQPIVDFDLNIDAKVMVASFHDANSDIWQVNKHSEGAFVESPVISNKLVDSEPGINRQGNRIAFNTKVANENRLYIRDIDKKGVTLIAHHDNANIKNIEWSPSSNKLAYIVQGKSSSELYVKSVVPHAETLIHVKRVKKVHWGSSDDRLIALVQNQDNSGLYEIDLKTGNRKLRIKGVANDFAKVGNNTFIYQKHYKAPILILSKENEQALWQVKPLINHPNIVNWKLAKDSVVAFVTENKQGKFCWFDLASGNQTHCFNSAISNELTPLFSVDQYGTRLVYTRQVNPGNDLYLLKSNAEG